MQNAGPGRLDTLRTTRMVSAGMGAGKALGEPGITLFMLLKVCILRFSGIKAIKKMVVESESKALRSGIIPWNP